MVFSRRQFLTSTACAAFGLSTGCGSILYPERIGQPCGPIDWKVVALDGLGLLLFVVPGVVAFAIDFYNGTIYLPPTEYPHYGQLPSSQNEGRQLTTMQVPPEQLNQQRIEEIVSEHAAQPVQLQPGQYRTQPLENAEEFWPAHDRLVRN